MATDTETVTREILSSRGIKTGAELIEARQKSIDSKVEHASRLRVNPVATEALDLSKIKPKDGGKVISASVRGDSILYAAEKRDGRVYKGVLPYKG